MSASEQSLAAEPAPATGSARRASVGFIVGPTGAGKSALAMEIAERLGAEIVNADARQVYRGMDIGTAKPSRGDLDRVPHHLIDVRSPAEPLDVAGFVTLARAAIGEIAARGHAALVVGGSGLYLRALRGGIFRGPAASPEIRERLARIAAEHGAGRLHDQLREIDPEAASRIGYRDLYRIVRALEVFEVTGEPISVHQRRHGFSARDFDCLTVGVAPDRKQLYEAIDRRFDDMIAAGFVGEVRSLLAAGLRPDRPPLSSIGYKHIAAHLGGEMTQAGAIALAKRDSRRLAKRQMTWFRHDPEIVWVDPSRPGEHALSLFSDYFARSRDGAAAERRAADSLASTRP